MKSQTSILINPHGIKDYVDLVHLKANIETGK